MRSCCCCCYCCCLAPDRKIKPFVVSIVFLIIIYNLLSICLYDKIVIYIDSIIINIGMLYFIGYKHKLVYSKSFKIWYIMFSLLVLFDLVINIYNTIKQIRKLFIIKDELLRYDNLNYTEQEINKIRSLKENDFNVFKTNITMSMENEDDRNYLLYFLEQQYEYGDTKGEIYNGFFYSISRIVIFIMLICLYNSTFKFYQIEKIEDEFVNDNLDKSRILDGSFSLVFRQIEKTEDKPKNECVNVSFKDKSRILEDEFTHESYQNKKIEDEPKNECAPNHFDYKSRILEDDFTLEFSRIEKIEDEYDNECITDNFNDKSKLLEGDFTFEFSRIEKIGDESGNECIIDNFNDRSRILEDELI